MRQQQAWCGAIVPRLSPYVGHVFPAGARSLDRTETKSVTTPEEQIAFGDLVEHEFLIVPLPLSENVEQGEEGWRRARRSVLTYRFLGAGSREWR